MKILSPEQTLGLVHNALYSYIDESGALRVSRFSEQQKPVYSTDRSHNFKEHLTASSNVTLECMTDSNSFAFEADFTPACRDRVTFVDFLVDGVLFDAVEIPQPYQRTRICFAAPEGVHRLTVFLPWPAETVIQNVAVDDGAFITETEKELRILSLGDSITQGYICKHPSQSYIGRITEALNAEVLNQGIGGYRMYRKSLTDDLSFLPDIITVAYGTNDYTFLPHKTDFSSYAASFYERLHELYPETPVLMITPIYRADKDLHLVEHDYSLEDACEILKATAAKYDNIHVLEGLSFYPHPSDFFVADYLHPNDLGDGIYAGAVLSALQKIISL